MDKKNRDYDRFLSFRKVPHGLLNPKTHLNREGLPMEPKIKRNEINSKGKSLTSVLVFINTFYIGVFWASTSCPSVHLEKSKKKAVYNNGFSAIKNKFNTIYCG